MQSSRSVTLVSLFLLSAFPAVAMAGEPTAGNHHPRFALALDGLPEQSISPRPIPRSRESLMAHALGKTTDTVVVNCAKGDSINAALTNPAVELTIQIKGVCTENVLILRDNVTLVGTSPATDGIRDDPSNTVFSKRLGVVFVAGISVRLEKLSIANGSLYGVWASNDGWVRVSDCDIFGNVWDGIVNVGGTVNVFNTTLHDNTRGGVSTWSGGDLNCTGCTISGSKWGGLSLSGSRLGLKNTNIEASIGALGAFEHGWISFDTGSFAGGIDSENQSAISISAGIQTAKPIGWSVWADVNSIVTANTGSVLLDPVELVQFSNLTLRGGSTITGDLSCWSGSNAFCANPSLVSGTTTGCSACVKP